MASLNEIPEIPAFFNCFGFGDSQFFFQASNLKKS